MIFEHIFYATDGQIGVITMNRPARRNAQGYRMLDELDQAFELARQDEAVRVILLRGTDGVFSTGHDLGTPEEVAYRKALGAKPGIQTYDQFKHWDLGDILAAEGTLFITRAGELTIRVLKLRLLTKSLRPLPSDFHGVADQEVKYRQRYVDLITDDDARSRFAARSKTIAAVRQFMVEHRFMEVETPMLHRSRAARTPSPSSRTTTRSTSRCSCASRPSST